MSAIANTYLSTDAVGNREELSNLVDRLTPEDTPFYSAIRAGTCVSTYPEWETEELAAPADNAQEEGDEYGYGTIDPPERMGNATQIFRKSFLISNTQEAVDNAGPFEKKKAQKLKKGVELRKDVEFAIVSNTASVRAGTRRLGGLPSWMVTNVDRGSGGANGGFNSGTGLTVAAGDGTQRAFTKALLDGVMQAVYIAGGDVRQAIVSPHVKSVFTTFMSDANVAQYRYPARAEGMNAIIATTDMYLGDFGELAIVPNRVMSASAATARNAYLVDPNRLAFRWLRPVAEDKNVAKTGDAEKCVLIGEGTLEVTNEAGLGVIADVFGLTAST